MMVQEKSSHPAYMRIAMGEVGVREIPGPRHSSTILDYLSTVRGHVHFKSDEISWCSAFINWCMLHAGVTGTNSPLARSWMTWGTATSEPREGDLVVFFRKDNNWGGHVGIFVTFSKDRKKVLVLGGNQGDEVSYRWYKVDGKLLSVAGYRRAV